MIQLRWTFAVAWKGYILCIGNTTRTGQRHIVSVKAMLLDRPILAAMLNRCTCMHISNTLGCLVCMATEGWHWVGLRPSWPRDNGNSRLRGRMARACDQRMVVYDTVTTTRASFNIAKDRHCSAWFIRCSYDRRQPGDLPA